MRNAYALLLFCTPLAQAAAQCTPVDCLSQLPAWGGLCQQSFVDGRVGVPYADAISFHVTNACTPASLFDPTLTTASVRITQINSIAFSGLPAGLTGTSNQASYTPPANGCGALSGTPTEAGVFEATVDMSVNVNVWPFSLTCGGFGPIANNNNPVSFGVDLVILPDPSFSAPAVPLCVTDAPVPLIPTGTPGGVFVGPGVSGGSFDPAAAGIGVHEVKYIVSAQEGAAVAPATDSLSVFIEVNDDCLGGCDAAAGTLSGLGTIPCINPGESVELIGIPGGDAVVPAGFEVVYVLTQGTGLVIVDAGPDPVFEATETGLHTIHTLVYDPATLDLGIIVLGVTTGFDVNALLIQGGGSICASLDVAGAPYLVEACAEPCDAAAGTLGGVDFIPCINPGESVELIGIPGGDAVVPAGFEVVYVLTQGAGLVIVDAGPDPVFEATETGLHTIHTLVYDPATLDLGIIEFGVTTGFDVNALLIQGGGSICASLDVAGAPYLVEACAEPCDAAAGTTAADGSPCLDANGEALLIGITNGDAVVPAGYVQTHVLTQGPGLVVINGNADPAFTVTATGEYRIHSLVIDPLTFQLAVEPGVTTGFDVLDYIVSSGICADLDPVGALFLVDLCSGIGAQAGPGFSVHPNPSAGGFFVVPDADGAALLELIDVSGRVAHAERIACTRDGAAWVQTAAAPGSYVARLTTPAGRREQRLAIQR